MCGWQSVDIHLHYLYRPVKLPIETNGMSPLMDQIMARNSRIDLFGVHSGSLWEMSLVGNSTLPIKCAGEFAGCLGMSWSSKVKRPKLVTSPRKLIPSGPKEQGDHARLVRHFRSKASENSLAVKRPKQGTTFASNVGKPRTSIHRSTMSHDTPDLLFQPHPAQVTPAKRSAEYLIASRILFPRSSDQIGISIYSWRLQNSVESRGI